MKKEISWYRSLLEKFFSILGMGMRAKLITLFIVIKVVPLVLLALVAWRQSWMLGEGLRERTTELAFKANNALEKTGDIAISDSERALTERARESIERMTTDTATNVARFLYARDNDILFVASLAPEEKIYKAFIEHNRGRIVKQGEWELAEDKKSWRPVPTNTDIRIIQSSIEENAPGFNYRPSEEYTFESRPLYLEITFLDLNGVEQLKVTSSPRVSKELKNVAERKNTFIGAETYFEELKQLKPGQVYVSEVIGAYVGSRVIGTYTPETAAKVGEEFNPANSAYAGKENPFGKRFEGLIRWATPVERNGKVVGYVTLALDHDHLMEFTAHLMPTDERYTEIPDASEGNYAFIWDYKGRNIVHPRHFSIVGYDPETGDPQVPWLEASVYDAWQASGLSYAEFIKEAPTFVEQSNSKKPALNLTKAGYVGLDCRYLNFAAQCTGWFDLTQDGGSGSFLILWSGLWKHNTAAAIPYYTGRYAASPRGFGFVTVGAGVDDFNRPAIETKGVIDALIAASDAELTGIVTEAHTEIGKNLVNTATSLSVSTGLMAVLVILIAIWMASAFTKSITKLINGISRFRSGERHFRFNAVIKDEIGTLADSFDEMADSLVDSVKGTLVITDINQNMIYCNEEGVALIGKTLKDVLGQPYAENSIFPPNSKYHPVTCLLQYREPEIFFYEPNQRYYKGTAKYFKNNTGGTIGYIITTNDVTDIALEQKKIEQQRALLDTVFSSSPDLIWYQDATGKYLATNPRFAGMIGKNAPDIVGKSIEDICPAEVALAFKNNDRKAIDSAMPLYTEEKLTFADEHTETVDSVRTPIFDAEGRYVGLLGVARDVSERVRVENELRIIQLELKNAVETANNANQAKSDFLARMSHEIRTPMNAIIGMTNIVSKKLTTEPLALDDVQTHVQQIATSSQHLLGLINDILEISKIEAGKIELVEEKFDLLKLVANVATLIEPRCEEKLIDFVVDFDGVDEATFVSDPLRIRQVLINLLGNAVKFTPEKGSIKFSVQRKEQKENKVRFHFIVADNGIGIPQEAVAHLFDPFEQGGAHITSQFGGTGLGLSISQNIVNLMDGEIAVESQVGKGSSFSFDLWLEEATANVVEEVVEERPDILFGKRVLLVDDVSINRLIVSELLGETGLIIDEAEDGTVAVDMFKISKEHYYDAILMDVQMPIMDGFQATEAIRAMNRADAEGVPIIALTANAFKEDVEKVLASGMTAHLAKPVEHEKLLAMLIRYAGKKKK